MKDSGKEPPIFRLVFIIFPAVVIVVFLVSFSYFLLKPVEINNPVIVEIQQGASLNTIAQDLYESGIITDIQKFKLLVRFMNLSKKIRSGEYEFTGRVTPLMVLKFITRGLVKKYNIIIPEGFTVNQIVQLLVEKGLGKEEGFRKILADEEFLKNWGLEERGVEGYLFPDTYTFFKGMSEREMLDTMIKNFFKKIPQDAERQAQRNNLTLYDAIILASIVQKETYRKDEMPVVAGVFYNRLRKGIPLQADPTVIYGIPDFSGDLKKSDLKIKSPYNTYIHRGLPPGPICNPGIDAINAVLNPANVPYLYFVSKNDGSHEFSVTLKEHNKKVGIYQLKRR